MDSRLLQGFFDFFDVVGTEVIHDYNVVFPECRNQIVLQVIHKLLPCSPSTVGRIVRFAVYAYGREDRCAFRRVQRHTSLAPAICVPSYCSRCVSLVQEILFSKRSR